MSFLGLFQFRAPYLPWVLLGFSLLLGNSPSIDLMGIVVGHVYYYCEDVFPYTPAGRGRQLLVTPRLLKLLVGQTDRQVDDTRVGQIDLTQMQQPQAPLPQGEPPLPPPQPQQPPPEPPPPVPQAHAPHNEPGSEPGRAPEAVGAAPGLTEPEPAAASRRAAYDTEREPAAATAAA